MQINNPIQQKLNEFQNPGNKIWMQAVSAMMRGETPQSFLRNLAKEHEEMQALDFTNPLQTAEEIYTQKGQNINAAKSFIMDKINAFIGLK